MAYSKTIKEAGPSWKPSRPEEKIVRHKCARSVPLAVTAGTLKFSTFLAGWQKVLRHNSGIMADNPGPGCLAETAKIPCFLRPGKVVRQKYPKYHANIPGPKKGPEPHLLCKNHGTQRKTRGSRHFFAMLRRRSGMWAVAGLGGSSAWCAIQAVPAFRCRSPARDSEPDPPTRTAPWPRVH